MTTHDVDGGDLQLALLVELVEVVDTGGGLLRDTLDLGKELRELCGMARRVWSAGLPGSVEQQEANALLWTMAVRSPPSSRIMLGLPPLAKAVSDCSMHQRYSSSVSPFQAKTGTPLWRSRVIRRHLWSQPYKTDVRDGDAVGREESGQLYPVTCARQLDSRSGSVVLGREDVAACDDGQSAMLPGSVQPTRSLACTHSTR